MKPFVIIPIVIGSALLIAGGALFGVAVYRNSQNSTIETKEYAGSELGAFNNFDIDLTIADLEFKTSDTTKVVVDETKYDSHTVEVSDNTLKIKGQDNRKISRERLPCAEQPGSHPRYRTGRQELNGY